MNESKAKSQIKCVESMSDFYIKKSLKFIDVSRSANDFMRYKGAFDDRAHRVDALVRSVADNIQFLAATNELPQSVINLLKRANRHYFRTESSRRFSSINPLRIESVPEHSSAEIADSHNRMFAYEPHAHRRM